MGEKSQQKTGIFNQDISIIASNSNWRVKAVKITKVPSMRIKL